MKKFYIVKDDVGGKLITNEETKYYTNEELQELYKVLGELWINQKPKAEITYNKKELLVQDLCARLPYGITIKDEYGDFIKVDLHNVNLEQLIDRVREGLDKLVLRPISSMTEYEKKGLFKAFNHEYAIIGSYCIDCNDSILVNPSSEPPGFSSVTYEAMRDVTHWFYKNGYDINDLIRDGMAVDATEEIYG